MEESLTIIPGSHIPKRRPSVPAVKGVEEFFQSSVPTHYTINKTDILASSFDEWDFSSSQTYSSAASLIRSAVEAWSYHSHLVLRPDDLWFTILVQMNFFMEKHAEQVRHIFVAHSGKKEIVVEKQNWQAVIHRVRDEIQTRIKTAWMSDWISPGFSTSTRDDELAANILMMGLNKAYFDYSFGIICGIPSITLLGTKLDWERLQYKVNRIDSFGKVAARYAKRLRPLLSRIVTSYDDPAGQGTRDFWDEMVHAKRLRSIVCGQPPLRYVISGWIVGLYYWDAEGAERGFLVDPGSYAQLEYDGVRYGEIALEDIPQGYATANVKVLNEHKGSDASRHRPGFVAAGNIGKLVTDGAPQGYEAAKRAQQQMHATPEHQTIVDDFEEHSTIQPLSGWLFAAPRPEDGASHGPKKPELSGATVDAVEACEVEEHEEL